MSAIVKSNHFYFSDNKSTVTFGQQETDLRNLDPNVTKLIIRDIKYCADLKLVLQSLPNLKELEFNGEMDNSILYTFFHCPNLETLKLIGVSFPLEEKGDTLNLIWTKISLIVGKLPKLTHIEIYNNGNNKFMESGFLLHFFDNIIKSDRQFKTISIDARNLFCDNINKLVASFLSDDPDLLMMEKSFIKDKITFPVELLKLIKVENLILHNLILDTDNMKKLCEVIGNNKEIKVFKFPNIVANKPEDSKMLDLQMRLAISTRKN